MVTGLKSSEDVTYHVAADITAEPEEAPFGTVEFPP